jgi:hypothetical protein
MTVTHGSRQASCGIPSTPLDLYLQGPGFHWDIHMTQQRELLAQQTAAFHAITQQLVVVQATCPVIPSVVAPVVVVAPVAAPPTIPDVAPPSVASGSAAPASRSVLSVLSGVSAALSHTRSKPLSRQASCASKPVLAPSTYAAGLLTSRPSDARLALLPSRPPCHTNMNDIHNGPWYYVDPQHKIQGPFRGDEIRDWLDAGYFRLDLPLSQTLSGPFHPLSSIFQAQNEQLEAERVTAAQAITVTECMFAPAAPTRVDALSIASNIGTNFGLSMRSGISPSVSAVALPVQELARTTNGPNAHIMHAFDELPIPREVSFRRALLPISCEVSF